DHRIHHALIGDLQTFAQPVHIDWHHLVAGRWRLRSPHPVEQLTLADRHVRAEHQGGQQSLLAERTEVQLRLTTPGAQRTQYSEPKLRTRTRHHTQFDHDRTPSCPPPQRLNNT